MTASVPAADANPEGTDDGERRRRLAEFVAKLRRMCLDLGAPADIVANSSATGLLAIYRELAEQDARRRAQLERLMQEPPRYHE